MKPEMVETYKKVSIVESPPPMNNWRPRPPFFSSLTNFIFYIPCCMSFLIAYNELYKISNGLIINKFIDMGKCKKCKKCKKRKKNNKAKYSIEVLDTLDIIREREIRLIRWW